MEINRTSENGHVIRTLGTGGRMILWLCHHTADEDVLRMERLIRENGGRDFFLTAFSVNDWNAELSPWAAPAVFRDGDAFAGQGAELLSLVRSRISGETAFIGGYSLAGLFALWALYEEPRFSGAFSGSGSLWFPGWAEYASSHTPKTGARVVLSLGKKEEKTRNPVLSAIGTVTQDEADRLTAYGCDVSYTVRPGGHFCDSVAVTAVGFTELLK